MQFDTLDQLFSAACNMDAQADTFQLVSGYFRGGEAAPIFVDQTTLNTALTFMKNDTAYTSAFGAELVAYDRTTVNGLMDLGDEVARVSFKKASWGNKYELESASGSACSMPSPQ